RPAEPGEFCRRAFLNGKMDLTEAEGLADLVAAETRQQARQARYQMDGALGRLYGRWQEALIGALAHVEAEIDFAPEEEVPDDLTSEIRLALDRLRLEIETHLDDGHRGERLRDGLKFALIGPTNAGKSSLINMLSKRDVAIVKDIPGTTRDVLEVPLDLQGYPITVVDMAGLRETDDPVEKLGVERARSRAHQADHLIALFDGAVWPDFDQATMALVDDRTVVVLNKQDLLNGSEEIDIGGRQALAISCRTGQGIDRLVDSLASLAKHCMAHGDAPALTRARHRGALQDVVAALTRIEGDIETTELVLMAENLRIAKDAIGRITGKVSVDDLLDKIFSEFCIGK
ncbi:MAG: tRNA uridine-5-carboxymethylaminomethyl(34) synthesis GTPase MnmE, partial [Geminicoccaceae bacterium]